MARNRIKGITVEIGGDTTKLDKALAAYWQRERRFGDVGQDEPPEAGLAVNTSGN